MSFDNLCKLLSEKYPDRFATWLLGQPPTSIKVLKTELSIEPIRADSISFLQTQERILHLEFQVKLESTPPLPLRLLDYWVRLYRLYRLPITQVVVLLLPPSEGTVIPSLFEVEFTRHEYQVVRMWEQDPTIFLNDVALLPLAALAAASVPEQLLNQIAQRVNQIELTQQRREVASYIQILAGLRFDRVLIQRLFREDEMRESVIYQDILQEGRQEGRQEEGVHLVLRQLTRRFGELDEQTRARIAALPLPLVEDLGEALLDFSQSVDLEMWLETHHP
jgi:predicted transposase YdaD